MYLDLALSFLHVLDDSERCSPNCGQVPFGSQTPVRTSSVLRFRPRSGRVSEVGYLKE